MERKPRSKFKTYVIVMLLIITASLFVSERNVAAKTKTDTATTDYKLMKKTVRQHYPGKKIKIVDGNGNEDKYWNVILHRKNKDYVVVEKVVSKGNGTRHGWYTTKDGNKYIIGYNKKVPKGKRVTSYVIWNPKTSYCDDVTYVVDNGKVR